MTATPNHILTVLNCLESAIDGFETVDTFAADRDLLNAVIIYKASATLTDDRAFINDIRGLRATVRSTDNRDRCEEHIDRVEDIIGDIQRHYRI